MVLMKLGDFIFSSDHSHLFRAKLRYVTDGVLQSILIAFRIFPSQVFILRAGRAFVVHISHFKTSLHTRVRRQTVCGHVQKTSTLDMGDHLTVPWCFVKPKQRNACVNVSMQSLIARFCF